MRASILFLAIVSLQLVHAADVCNPSQLTGPYTYQLSGTTTISGAPQPTVSLGRIVFDGSGVLSGTASVSFSGVVLGNPVTGSYEAKSDCSLTWKLQDDSGGFQNFKGNMSTNLERIQFSQSDTGGVKRGIMLKLPDSCSTTDLHPGYTFTVSGNRIAMQAGEVPGKISAQGVLDVATNGTFQVESDCTVHFQLAVPAPEGETVQPPSINVRGFLTLGGKEILAFQTDPGAMVSVHLLFSPPVAK